MRSSLRVRFVLSVCVAAHRPSPEQKPGEGLGNLPPGVKDAPGAMEWSPLIAGRELFFSAGPHHESRGLLTNRSRFSRSLGDE
jgi:hypothetical protein